MTTEKQQRACRCCECRQRIDELEKSVTELRRQIARLKGGSGAGKSIWPDNTFNYLAIGNSLTIHETCKYWWNCVGMAASDADHDYFHLVRSGLGKRFGKVTARTFPFSAWERTAHDRDQTLSDLDRVLDARLALVTVQLGENVVDAATFAEDYVSLIEYIRRKTEGRAQIIVVGDFWHRDAVRSDAARKCGVDYVSLDDMHDVPEYRSRIGATVLDAEGKEHVIGHSGVAKHPGDKGMAEIAGRILNAVRPPAEN